MTWRKIIVAVVVTLCLGVVATLYNRSFIRPMEVETDADVESPDIAESVDGQGILETHYPELLPLFPDPNDWRRRNAIVTSFNRRQIFILSKGGPDFSKDNRTVSLGTCTVVFFNNDPEKNEEERALNSIVFELTERIELTFADPLTKFFKLDSKNKSFDLNKFESGKIRGEVIFRTRLGESDVVFNTRDVVFNATQIHTNSDVAFSIGPNSGTGKGLTVDIEPPHRFFSRSRGGGVKSKAVDLESPEGILANAEEEGNIGGGFSLKGIQLAQLDGCLKFYSDSLDAMKPKKKVEEQTGEEGETSEEDGDSSPDPGKAAVLAASGLLPADAVSEGWNAESESDAETGNFYFEARCKGSLYFSSNPNIVGGWGLRLYKMVELVGFQDGMKTVQVLCDTLYIYLQDKKLAACAENMADARDEIQRKKVTGALSRLELTNIRAVKGEKAQVVVRYFDSNVELLSDEIQYDLERYAIELISDSENVSIRQTTLTGAIDFSAQKVRVSMNKLNEIESVYAGEEGKLVFTDLNADGTNSAVETYWSDGIYIAPVPSQPDYLKIATSGSVDFHAESFGAFHASEGDAWCHLGEGSSKRTDTESAPSFDVKALGNIRPICVEFRKNVVYHSNRGAAAIGESAQVRFETRDEGSPAPVAQEEKDGVYGSFSETGDDEFWDEEFEDAPADSLFDIKTRALEARCLITRYPNAKPKCEVKRLTLLGNVLFREQNARESKENIRLSAEAIQIDNPISDARKILLRGTSQEPALFKTERLALEGSDVTVDGGTNFFQVLGAGKLQLQSPLVKEKNEQAASQAIKQASAQIPTSGAEQTLGQGSAPEDAKNDRMQGAERYLTEEPISIEWTNSMKFDGKQLSFISDNEENVVVSQGAQRLLCHEARVSLTEPLTIFDFDVESKDALVVETIECLGQGEQPIDIEVRSLPSSDPKERESHFHVLARSLSFNVETGSFVVNGNGVFYALVPTEGESIGTIGQKLNAKDAPVFEPKKESKWSKINARFNGAIQGSVNTQEATIADGFRAVVATTVDPAVALSVDDLNACPKDTVLLEGREAYLRVLKGAAADVGKQRTNLKQDFEVETRNNVVFRQGEITGVCDSLRYSSLKNTLVLTGTKSSKAAIYRQKYNGALREELGAFSRATYQLDTKKFNVESLTHGE